MISIHEIYPVPTNEKERLNALKNYEILDSLSEEEFDRVTELASLIDTVNYPVEIHCSVLMILIIEK